MLGPPWDIWEPQAAPHEQGGLKSWRMRVRLQAPERWPFQGWTRIKKTKNTERCNWGTPQFLPSLWWSRRNPSWNYNHKPRWGDVGHSSHRTLYLNSSKAPSKRLSLGGPVWSCTQDLTEANPNFKPRCPRITTDQFAKNTHVQSKITKHVKKQVTMRKSTDAAICKIRPSETADIRTFR